MSKLIVKDTALINATYSLTLAEQRLLLLTILETRKKRDGETDYNKSLVVTADSYMETFNVNRNAAYESLQSASKHLFERKFSYQKTTSKGKVMQMTTRWLSEIGYATDCGQVTIRFAQSVIPLITQLERHFTSYAIEQIAGLSSGYAVRLYELLIAWRKVGKVPPMQLQELRDRLGVLDDEYPRIERFKVRVLQVALDQINEHTDINAKYEQHKVGRKIDSISFTFKQKASAKRLTNDDGFIKMTSDQLRTFSSKLARLPELGGDAPQGKDFDYYASVIADELKDATKQKKYHKHLAKVGFKSAKSSGND